MGAKKYTFVKNNKIEPCPKCGNNTIFICVAEQFCEDCCNTWVECGVCGFDPTRENTDYRFENVWGGFDLEHCHVALDCWAIAIEELFSEEVKSSNK